MIIKLTLILCFRHKPENYIAVHENKNAKPTWRALVLQLLYNLV